MFIIEIPNNMRRLLLSISLLIAFVYVNAQPPTTQLPVDPETKKFTVEVGVPPTTALIAKEAGITKGSGTSGKDYVGNISMENIVKIARMKIDVSYAIDLKNASKEIIGSCVSSGIMIENKPAKEIYADVEKGQFDSLFN